MAEGLDVIINGVETVSEKMDDIENSVRTANQALSGLSGELREASISSEVLESSSDSVATSATKVNGAVRGAAGAVDELGDESREAAVEVGLLGTVMDKTSVSAGALSINVGAFTIALRQLHTQIPLIVTTLGSLISVLGGVGAAAIAAGGGISALLAGGAIGLLEDIESQFADVTSTGEALQKLMRGLGNMFREALDPLVNAENVELFVSLLEDMANFANRSAQAIDASRESIMRFFSVVGQSADFNRFAGSLQNVMEFEAGGEFDSAGEVLARFLGYLVGELPDAIDFFNRVTVNLAEPLQEVAYQFKLLTIELVEFAEGAAPGALGVVSTLLSVFTALFESLNDLSGTFVSSAIQAFAFTAVLLRLARVFDTVAAIGNVFALRIGDLTGNLNSFTNTAARAAALGQGFLDEYLSGVYKLSRSLAAQIPILKDVQIATGELYDGDELIDFDDRVKIIEGNLKNLKSTAGDVADTIRKRFTEFAIDDELIEAPEMGGFRYPAGAPDSMGGQAASLELNTKKFRQALGTVRSRALSTAKTIGSGFGDIAVGGLEVFTGAMTGMVHPGLLRSEQLSEVFNDGLSRMATGLNKMGLGIIPNTIGSLKEYIAQKYASIKAIKLSTISTKVNAAAQKILQRGLLGNAKAALKAVAGMITYAGSLIIAAVSAATLSSAMLPVTLAVLALTAAGALAVGVLGNMGDISSTAKSSFESLKNFAVELGNALLGYLVPAFNLIVSIFGAILSPVFAIVDAFKFFISRFSEVLSQGEEGKGIMESFAGVMDFLGGILEKIAPVFDVIGNVLYSAVFLTLKAIAVVVIEVIKLVQTLISVLQRIAKESGLIDFIKNLANIIISFVTGAIDQLADTLNKLISLTNALTGSNIGKIGEGEGGASSKLSGLKVTEDDVVGNAKSLMEKDSESGAGSRAETTSPDFSLETNIQNTANVDAESDESEDRIATLVERAMKDANTYRRNALGGQ